jgi:hypothetical protein
LPVTNRHGLPQQTHAGLNPGNSVVVKTAGNHV